MRCWCNCLPREQGRAPGRLLLLFLHQWSVVIIRSTTGHPRGGCRELFELRRREGEVGEGGTGDAGTVERRVDARLIERRSDDLVLDVVEGHHFTGQLMDALLEEVGLTQTIPLFVNESSTSNVINFYTTM